VVARLGSREKESFMAKPVVDAELCTGCGTCEALCPEVFEVRDDGIAYVIDPGACDQADCCEEAAESCPEEAISFVD
jgi:ferredoxin